MRQTVPSASTPARWFTSNRRSCACRYSPNKAASATPFATVVATRGTASAGSAAERWTAGRTVAGSVTRRCMRPSGSVAVVSSPIITSTVLASSAK
jgi:hypothetical protein